jgi:DNA-binding transcriptional LysR family regulator
MDLRPLECFISVAQHLHFRRAAEEIHLSISTVSSDIQRLELQLGSPLLERSTRSVSLTEFGLTFLPEAEALCAHARDTFQRAQASVLPIQRRLVIGMFSPVDDFGKQFSQLERRGTGPLLELRQMTVADEVRALERRDLDAAILLGDPRCDGWQSRLLDTIGVLALVCSDHAFAKETEVSIDAVASQPLCFVERDSSPWLHASITDSLDRTGMKWDQVEETTNPINLVRFAASGRGVALIPGLESLGFLKRGGEGLRPYPGVVAVPVAGGPMIAHTIAWRCDGSSRDLEQLIDLLVESTGAQGSDNPDQN